MKQDSSVNLFEILAKFLEFYQFISKHNSYFIDSKFYLLMILIFKYFLFFQIHFYETHTYFVFLSMNKMISMKRVAEISMFCNKIWNIFVYYYLSMAKGYTILLASKLLIQDEWKWKLTDWALVISIQPSFKTEMEKCKCHKVTCT